MPVSAEIDEIFHILLFFKKWPEYETTLTCLLYLTFPAEGKDSECAAGCQKTPPCCEVDTKLTFPLYGRSLSSNSVVEIVQGLGDIRQPIIYHECRSVCQNFISFASNSCAVSKFSNKIFKKNLNIRVSDLPNFDDLIGRRKRI